MRQTFTSAAILLVLAIGGCATSRGMAADGGAERTGIAELRNEWYTAYLRGGAATLDRIEAEDFVVIGPDGRAGTAEGRYARIQEAVKANRWFAPGTTRGPEQVQMRSYGDVVLVHGRTSPQPGSSGQGSAFTEVWVRRNGRWEVAHLHFHPAQ